MASVLCHDDGEPRCNEPLVDGFCVRCGFAPDMQSTCFREITEERKMPEIHGAYVSDVRTPEESIRYATDEGVATFYLYEPGNATRYEVVFTSIPGQLHGGRDYMSVVNFRKAMEVHQGMGEHSVSYMQEKLNLGISDCYALSKLIEHHFARRIQRVLQNS
jgi:hypothetical protein